MVSNAAGDLAIQLARKEDISDYMSSEELAEQIMLEALSADTQFRSIKKEVRCIIEERKEENEANNRKRGYTEFISVKEGWRGNGIAQALMADTLKKLKERGMEEAALGVDAENPSGALGLYRKMGFEVRKKVLFLRKEIDS